MKYTVVAKEWFDRVNGNSYYSMRIFKDNKLIQVFGMDCGYESMYEQVASEYLRSIGEEFDYLREVAVSAKHDKCLKRDVISWGNN